MGGSVRSEREECKNGRRKTRTVRERRKPELPRHRKRNESSGLNQAGKTNGGPLPCLAPAAFGREMHCAAPQAPGTRRKDAPSACIETPARLATNDRAGVYMCVVPRA